MPGGIVVGASDAMINHVLVGTEWDVRGAAELTSFDGAASDHSRIASRPGFGPQHPAPPDASRTARRFAVATDYA